MVHAYRALIHGKGLKFWIVETNTPVESMRVAAICESHSEIYANHWSSPYKPIKVVERAAIDIMLKDLESMAKALSDLVALKKDKDLYGKTPEYEERQPLAWIKASEALKNYRERYKAEGL